MNKIFKFSEVIPCDLRKPGKFQRSNFNFVNSVQIPCLIQLPKCGQLFLKQAEIVKPGTA